MLLLIPTLPHHPQHHPGSPTLLALSHQQKAAGTTVTAVQPQLLIRRCVPPRPLLQQVHSLAYVLHAAKYAHKPHTYQTQLTNCCAQPVSCRHPSMPLAAAATTPTMACNAAHPLPFAWLGGPRAPQPCSCCWLGPRAADTTPYPLKPPDVMSLNIRFNIWVPVRMVGGRLPSPPPSSPPSGPSWRSGRGPHSSPSCSCSSWCRAPPGSVDPTQPSSAWRRGQKNEEQGGIGVSE